MTRIVNKVLTQGAVIVLMAALSSVSFASEEKPHKEPAKPARSGAELSATCAACHGAEGASISDDFPNIAGQHRSYLLYALKGYRSGERINAIMQSFVKDLSDEELENLAGFYASNDGLKTLPRD